MTQEDKKLLLTDLCARLPYGVICHYNCVTSYDDLVIHKANCSGPLEGIVPMSNGDIGFMVGMDKINALQGDIKPYLRPMSSMTEEEKKELQKAFNIKSSIIGEYGISSNNAWWVKDRKEPLGFDTIRYTSFCGVTDYLNSIHVDYRGLIDKCLALKAPTNMYKKGE